MQKLQKNKQTEWIRVLGSALTRYEPIAHVLALCVGGGGDFLRRDPGQRGGHGDEDRDGPIRGNRGRAAAAAPGLGGPAGSADHRLRLAPAAGLGICRKRAYRRRDHRLRRAGLVEPASIRSPPGCHTGEGRFPWQGWVPAFAGKSK